MSTGIIDTVTRLFGGVVSFVTELWNVATGTWSWFSGVMKPFADIGLRRMADLVARYGGNAEPTAVTTLLGGVYVLVTVLPGLVLTYFLLKSILRDQRKAAAGAVVWKLGGIGVMGYILKLRPTPTEVFSRISKGPVVLVDALGAFMAKAGYFKIATTFGMFGLFFVMAWGMFYAINLATYFVGILIRPNPPWSESSGRGHALLYTILWIFFMTTPTMSAAMAFVNVMIINIIILWRRAEWRESLRSSGVELTPEAIAEAVMESRTRHEERTRDDVPEGTERIDYRRRK